MPIFSSDSGNSVHSLLGGGRVADVMLWRDKKTSSAIMLVVTFIWFFIEVLEYNIITLLSHIFITLMLIIFFWYTVLTHHMISPVSFKTFLTCFALYNDLILFAKAVLFLWLLTLIGNKIGPMNLLFLGTLSLETLPFLYERYEKEVDYLVGKVYEKMWKIYKKFDSDVLDKIPRGPINGKKAN